jgi:hypothetical protein
MYIEEGVWGSKPAAGVWAVTRTPLAAQALEARQTAAELQPEEVRTFVERVLALVEAAARGHT